MNDFFDDTKALRKSMFICQNERVDHIMKVKMKRMGWSRRRLQLSHNGSFGDGDNPTSDPFSLDCRALSNSDVLEHIVLHLTDTDLFTCRLVCKFWSAEMAYFLSKRKSLVITDEHSPTAEEIMRKRLEGQPVSLSKLGFFDVGSNCPIFNKLFQVFGWTLSIVNLEGCNLSPFDLKQMLFVNAPNIENLHFREEYFGNQRPSFNGCILKQIKRLNDGNLCLPKMKVLHFKLPSVSELEIVSNHHEQQNWNSLTKRATTAPPCTNLRFFRCGEIDLKSLDRMMKVFPHITYLNIYASHVDDRFLRSIYLNLSLLMDLTISPCLQTHVLPVTDSGITGLSADKCSKLQKNLNKWSETEIQAARSQPDIGKLQCLQTLDLSFQVSNMISDVSVLFGIARLPKLKTLKMPVCRVTDISLSVIEEKLGQLVILGISGCKQISADAISNFKKNRKNILLDLDLPEMLENYR